MTLVGLELLHNHLVGQFRNNNDYLICAIHCGLLSNGFKLDVDGRETEVFPTEWNNDASLYTLHYVKNSEKYILKCIPVGDTVLVNLLRNSDSLLSSCELNTSNFITDETNFSSRYTNLSQLSTTITNRIASPHSSSSEQQSNTSEQHLRERRDNPRRDIPTNPDPDRSPQGYSPLRQPRQPHGGGGGWFPPENPLAVGGTDLDPLGRIGGGGMLMDPRGFRQPIRDPNAGLPPGARLPPGAVPPGARFDPFGPNSIPGNRDPSSRGPDPDHERPPGFDDMFM